MKSFWRSSGALILLTLLIVTRLMAQETNNTITVVGSAIAAPVFQELTKASQVQATVQTNITGTSDGLSQLCAGKADAALASRPITIEEDSACTQNKVEYSELLIGHNIIAFIVNPGSDYVQCLAPDNVNVLFEPSAQGQITKWNQVLTSGDPQKPVPDAPLSVILPKTDSPVYTVLNELVKGDGVRADATIANTETDVVLGVSKQPGAIGVVRLGAATAAGNSVRILNLDAGAGAGCSAPSAETVEGRSYTGADRMLLYVNRASLTKAGFKDILTFAVGENAAAVINGLGFSAPSTKAYETDRAVLAGTQTGRQFSREVVSYQIPSDIKGKVTIGGSPSGYDYLKKVTDALTQKYAGVTFDYKIDGEPAGLRRLCNGEVDIVLASGSMSDDQKKKCADNKINTIAPIDLGTEAVVLVANGESPYLACLTLPQITTIWSAKSADPANLINNWKQVEGITQDSKPVDVPFTLFSDVEGDTYTDLLLTKAAGITTPIRLDVAERKADALYRAAATANVKGALTYMSWKDYQRVLVNNQKNIQLVGVNGGNGCIMPSPETISNGTYPLTRHAWLIVSQQSLARPEVQSTLWFMSSDDNFKLLDDSGFIGVTFGDLPLRRDMLQQEFNAAKAEAAVRAEATPEATSEATPQATP